MISLNHQAIIFFTMLNYRSNCAPTAWKRKYRCQNNVTLYAIVKTAEDAPQSTIFTYDELNDAWDRRGGIRTGATSRLASIDGSFMCIYRHGRLVMLSVDPDLSFQVKST